MKRRPRQSRAGFTLLELLISLALLTVLSAALLQTFGLGIRMNEASRTRQEIADGIALRYQLRRWLIEAGSPTIVSELPLDFVGGPTSFTFTTLSEIYFAENAEGMRILVNGLDGTLSLRATVYSADGDVLDIIEDQIASYDVRPIFSYYDGLAEEWRAS